MGMILFSRRYCQVIRGFGSGSVSRERYVALALFHICHPERSWRHRIAKPPRSRRTPSSQRPRGAPRGVLARPRAPGALSSVPGECLDTAGKPAGVRDPSTARVHSQASGRSPLRMTTSLTFEQTGPLPPFGNDAICILSPAFLSGVIRSVAVLQAEREPALSEQSASNGISRVLPRP